MNREEYLNQLKKYLRRLPSDDYQNAMDYFTEYFEEAGPEGEAAVIKELGTPQEAAAELLSALLDEKIRLLPESSNKKEKSRRYRTGDPVSSHTTKSSPLYIMLIVFLFICAAPIAAPLAIAAVVLLLAGLLVLGCGILCVFIFSISAVILGIYTLIKSFALLSSSWAAFCLMLGGGLLATGFAILLFIVGIFLCKWIGLGLIRFTQWMLQKRKVKKDE